MHEAFLRGAQLFVKFCKGKDLAVLLEQLLYNTKIGPKSSVGLYGVQISFPLPFRRHNLERWRTEVPVLVYDGDGRKMKDESHCPEIMNIDHMKCC